MQRALALVLASAVTVTACGGDTGSESVGAPSDDTRTIEVVMTDMAYAPAELDVAPGETVTFVFRNDGAVRHEAVFGNLAEQEAHHTEMAEMGGSHEGMDMGTMPHDGETTVMHAVVLEPGESVEMTHTFDTAGPTVIGCHEPGHWEAGMKMDIDV
jgi:uncharacterized cupredoxin-like copper-binding protein